MTPIKQGLISLLFIIVFSLPHACRASPEAAVVGGWEVIYLNAPPFLSFIKYSSTDQRVYIFGGDQMQIVTTGANFTLENETYSVDWHLEFIGLDLFYNWSDVWAIGSLNPNDYSGGSQMYGLPVAIGGPIQHETTTAGLDGFILYSTYVDSRNLEDVLAYMVGYVPVSNGNETIPAFGVVRFHCNMSGPLLAIRLSFNYTNDVLVLAYTQFFLYNSQDRIKPQLHYNNSTDTLIILNSAINTIHVAQVGPGITPMTRGRSILLAVEAAISSSVYNVFTNLLYVGFTQGYRSNASIFAYSGITLDVQFAISFNGALSTPHALVIDEVTDTLYVGFNDGNYVMQLNYLLNIEGWQNVPSGLTLIGGAAIDRDYVYFITSEQKSKVMRVSKNDFCKNPCAITEYCKMGKCIPLQVALN